jgi:hypothetical protein
MTIKRGWTTVMMPVDVLVEATYDGPGDTSPSIRYIDHENPTDVDAILHTDGADDLDLSKLDGIEPTDEGRD